MGPVVPECPAQMYGTTVEISIRSLGSLQVYVHVAMCIRMSGEWLGNPSMFPFLCPLDQGPKPLHDPDRCRCISSGCCIEHVLPFSKRENC